MSYGRIMNGGAVEDWARSDTVEAMGDLFRALATPVRLSIVMELSAAPRAVGELVEALGVSQPLVSQHLRVLRAARLTVSETSWPRGSSSSDVTGGVPSSRALAGAPTLASARASATARRPGWEREWGKVRMGSSSGAEHHPTRGSAPRRRRIPAPVGQAECVLTRAARGAATTPAAARGLRSGRGAGWRTGRPDWRIRRSGPPPAPGCRGGRGGSRRGNV